MRRVFHKSLFFLFLLIPLIVGFRFLFLTDHLVWGDAPYFFSEGLEELSFEPRVWVERGVSLGGINPFLWLSPWMVLYGLLGKIFSLGNDLIIRLLFYFPSLVLSFVGPVLLTRKLKMGNTASFFAGLFYVFNTYYLLLVDGGQVGVILAYGLFPFLILSLRNLLEKASLNNFFLALFFSFLVTTVDPRFYLIGLFSLLTWFLFEALIFKKSTPFRNLFLTILSVITLIPLNFYWIYPYLKLGLPKISTQVTQLNLISLLNSLFLFQPHWPQNLFGNVSYPQFYFALVPLFIFLNLFFRKNKKTFPILMTFLVFAFLAKGATPPFPGIYDFLISKIPFGGIFRDSSKFFTPLFLLGGVLIGNTVERISLGKKKFKIIIPFVFIYLLFLVFPLFRGELNWNLSERNNPELEKINSVLRKDDSDFFRSVWFYEKPSIAFETENKPALDAKNLINFRPFSSLNAGTYDSANYVYQGNWQDWYRLLGIKYLIFPGNVRQLEFTQKETDEWNSFLNYLEKEEGIEKIEEDEGVPMYELGGGTGPVLFGLDKLFVVVGADDVYEKIEERLPLFSRSNQGFLFVEDGKFSLDDLEIYSADSLVFVLNSKNDLDLAMYFLKDNFLSTLDAKENSWRSWRSEDYLDYKFQLLMRGVETREFDYQKGISFSTQEGEDISFTVKLEDQGEYLFALRTMQATNSAGISFAIDEKEYSINPDGDAVFSWFIDDSAVFEKGVHKVIIKNNGGLNVVNTLAFIPKEEYLKALNYSREIMVKFETIDLSNESGFSRLIGYLSDQNKEEIEYTSEELSSYRLTEVGDFNWIILNQSYNPNWRLTRGTLVFEPLPVYSMLNGFYVDDTWDNFEIAFGGQRIFRWGVYVTVVTLLLSFSLYLYLVKKDEEDN